jgi:hypothetical protein
LLFLFEGLGGFRGLGVQAQFCERGIEFCSPLVLVNSVEIGRIVPLASAILISVYVEKGLILLEHESVIALGQSETTKQLERVVESKTY